MKPTQGPWNVSSSFIVVDSQARILANCIRTGIPVLDVPFDEGVANARLMAAAPDLLAALQECAELLDDYSDVNDGGDGPVPNRAMSLLQTAEAVIAKAEGTK